MSDPAAALELIGRTAVLQFKQVVQAGEAPPPEANRTNYRSDEDFDRARANWAELMKEYDESLVALEETVKDDPNLTVGRDENDGRAYVLGEVYVSGG